jgi:hypothetical protein
MFALNDYGFKVSEEEEFCEMYIPEFGLPAYPEFV